MPYLGLVSALVLRPGRKPRRCAPSASGVRGGVRLLMRSSRGVFGVVSRPVLLTVFVERFHRPLRAPFEVASHQHERGAALKIDSPLRASPCQHHQSTVVKIHVPPGAVPKSTAGWPRSRSTHRPTFVLISTGR